jgi:hypothetical protein
MFWFHLNILNESKQSVTTAPGKHPAQTQNFSNKVTTKYKKSTGWDYSLCRGIQKKSQLNE